MNSIQEIQQEIVDEFALFDEWMDKYEHIIELGKDLPLIDEKYKTDENLIKGCQSKVWLHAELKDGKIIFTADSDAIITKGIVGLVIRVFSNHTPQEIIDADLFFIDQIGLQEHLSPTRSNGLLSMLKQIRMYAVVFNSKVGS
ncbi:MAG: SufE family protein [Flavobacteriales bacterium]|nr:SufE family protein [Flavobacteriales bacterium]MCW8912161.1 SufE family protein [Flavobacteriales bacterium]MCW8938030.1 SufE family protein [Flavobacteriales bacterium]MCW8940057.1 SufE family protein [Flavobacteriales bacterium]MCW8967251.1 SufE family protein [Flavobacteriales bacterium]